MSTLRICTILLLAVLSLGFSEEPVTVTSQYYGAKMDIPARIFKPDGAGPFPAVVWLHHCGGVSVGTLSAQWAKRLTSWGYLVAVPDSFSPRGIHRGVCADPDTVGAEGPRAADAFATLRYLQSRPDVIATKIGVQGHSHGGATTFILAQEHYARLYSSSTQPGFAAAVAYYPYCAGASSSPLATPLLILMGAKDDWTPAELCELAAGPPSAEGQRLTLKVYPNAQHSFDDQDRAPMTLLGHRLEYDAQAAPDSFEQVRSFFGRYLKGEGPQ
jgi:dienelactone hydrolase